MINLRLANFFHYAKQLGKDYFNAIVVDMPYGLFGNGTTLDDLKWDTRPDLDQLSKILNALLINNGVLIVFADFELVCELMSRWNDLFQLREHFIWEKPGAYPSHKSRALRVHEFVLIFMKKDAKISSGTWNPKVLQGEPYTKRNKKASKSMRRQKKSAVNENLSGLRHIRTVLQAPHKPTMYHWERKGISHLTIKPVKLIETLLKTYTNVGDNILEPFGGSASAALASYLINRNCISFEYDSTSFMEAVQRFQRVKSMLDGKIINGYTREPISSNFLNGETCL